MTQIRQALLLHIIPQLLLLHLILLDELLDLFEFDAAFGTFIVVERSLLLADFLLRLLLVTLHQLDPLINQLIESPVPLGHQNLGR